MRWQYWDRFVKLLGNIEKKNDMDMCTRGLYMIVQMGEMIVIRI